MRRWHWGYVPILILWLLICNECFQAQRRGSHGDLGKADEGGGGPARDVAAEFEKMVQDLASADAAVRGAAQSTLAKLPYQQRELLREAAQSTKDPTLKGLLVQRLDQIDSLVTSNHQDHTHPILEWFLQVR